MIPARTGRIAGLNYQKFYLQPMPPPSSSSLLETLVDRLAGLPSIGRKSAQRLAYHVLAAPLEEVEGLSRALIDARRSVRPCALCGNHAEAERCAICLNPRRDATLVCVVERPADVAAFERLGTYRGLYHVLGGTLSALDGVGPEDLNIAKLVARSAEGGVKEVIVATNATVDGQTTAHYLTERLKPTGVAISRLAHGVPVGGELDYLDDGTLTAALKARRPF